MKISLNNNINNYPLMKNNKRANYIQQQETFGGAAQAVEEATKRLTQKQSVQKFLQKPFFNKFLKTSMDNPGLYESMIALLITCTARPLTVLATPGAKIEDKQYAAAQSIASGISGLFFAYVIFNPIKDAISNIFKKVNNDNVKQAFRNFYDNKENTKIIEELTNQKIIPDLATFNAEYAKKDANIYKFMENYFINGADGQNGKGAKSVIDNLLVSSGNIEKKESWAKLAKSFSEKLNGEYSKIKFNNILEHKKYLVHKKIDFLKEGAYKISLSEGASKANFILNYTSKIILFPIIAAATIWAVPKIMKLIFPNHKKTQKNKQNSMKKQTLDNNVYKNFNNKPASNNKQVSFSGSLSKLSQSTNKIYDKMYKKPLAKVLEKVFDELTFSRNWFSKKMHNLLEKATVKKYGMEVFDRDATGKIKIKADNNFYVANISNIAALAGSCLYIFNTIRNKEIEPERKPALCTNMAVVAIFSLLASKGIEKITKPFFNILAKAHAGLMRNKINFDSNQAWQNARQMLVTTFAFRYLGPVLATPTADKLVKLFNHHKEYQAQINQKK